MRRPCFGLFMPTIMTVEEILVVAVSEGYLTPAVAEAGLAHSSGFLDFSDLPHLKNEEAMAADLGTGGGVPGLVLAMETCWVWFLVERSQKRASFLRWALRELGLEDRTEVILADVVEVARGPLREKLAVVTARSFAPPGPTAECAAPLLKPQGLLLVSEPPTEWPLDSVDFRDGLDTQVGSKRWISEGLQHLGLSDVGGWRSGGASYRAIQRVSQCPEHFPRQFHRQLAKPVF